MKITEYPSATFFDDGDVLLKDGSNGTKKMATSDLVYALFDGIPEMHNQIYRGKNLGTIFTETQKQTISDGKFHDLWIGDYWVIDGRTYRIVDFDSFYGVGTQTHHAVIIPDAPVDSTAYAYHTADDGTKYGASSLRTTSMQQSKTIINSAFSDGVLTYRNFLPLKWQSNTWITGQWFDCTVEIPTLWNVSGPGKAWYGMDTLPQNIVPFAIVRFDPNFYKNGLTQGGWLNTEDYGAPKNNPMTMGSDGIIVTFSYETKKQIKPFFLIK